MKNSKITKEQLMKMHQYLSEIKPPNKGQKNDLKFYYSALTPKHIYVRYVSYSLNGDNSINSNINLIRISENGDVLDMLDQLVDFKQILDFQSYLIEVDLDANGNIVFV